MDDAALLRYSRHILLKEIGVEGQAAIDQAVVLVVGCGGLGATVIPILASAGVGKLIIADDDILEMSNLPRQIAYDEKDVGQPKVLLAKKAIQQRNAQVVVEAISSRLEAGTLIHWMAQASVVVDCSDNYSTRHAINRVAVATQTPLVSGAASRFDGQLTVYDSRQPNSPCYACLFDPLLPSEDGRCATLGIFSPLVSMIGSWQAAETLKLITQVGHHPIGQLMVYDALSTQTHTFTFSKRAACAICGQKA